MRLIEFEVHDGMDADEAINKAKVIKGAGILVRCKHQPHRGRLPKGTHRPRGVWRVTLVQHGEPRIRRYKRREKAPSTT